MNLFKTARLAKAAILSFSIFFSINASGYDLSTPQKSLEALTAAEKPGYVISKRSIYSKELLQSEETRAKEIGLPVQNLGVYNPYDKIEILRKDEIDDRATFYLKVWYQDAWLKDMEIKGVYDEDKTYNREDGASIGPGGSIGTLNSIGTGVFSEYPFEKKGIGYVMYFFIKEDNQWKFLSGVTFRTSIDPTKFPLRQRYLEKKFDIEAD